MNALLNALLSGIITGSLYAIMALGMTIIYGVSRIFNFAHGVIAVAGGYVAWYLLTGLGMGLIPSALIVALVMGGFGWLVYRAFVGSLLRKANWEIATILFTLGFGILLENVLLQVFGPRVKAVAPFFEQAFSLGVFQVSYHDLVLLVAVVAGILLIDFFLKHAKPGMAMRAVAQSLNGAKVVGIDIDKMFGYTFALGFAITGFSGLLLATKYFLNPHVGWEFLSKGFVIVAFGGLGNPLGAILAALILGVLEALVTLYLGSVWVWPVWFVIFAAILILRPQGILGGRQA